MQYLTSKKPESSLWPAEERSRADITRWQMWRLGDWERGASTLTWQNVFKKLVTGSDSDPAEIKRGSELFDASASILNGYLEKHDFLVGSAVTLADLSIAAAMIYAVPARLPIDKYPAIRQWYGRIEKLESWKKSQP